MAVLEKLSEEEMYLYCILSDPSGLDQMEFMIQDHETPERQGVWRAWSFQHCLAAETPVITKTGVRPISDLVGDVELLTQCRGTLGKWVQAKVQSFGVQELWEVTLERYGVEKTIRATAEHRWFASADRHRIRHPFPEVLTRDLMAGMFLKSVYPPNRIPSLKVAPYGVVHGFVWGDGTTEKNGGCHVNLWGEDLIAIKPFMVGEGTPLNRPDVSVPGETWSLLPRGFNRPVSLDESSSYLFGWLAGYFAADGSVAPDGTCSIGSVDQGSIKLVRDVCHRLGLNVGDAAYSLRSSSFSETKTPYYELTLVSSQLPEQFFLKPSHLRKFTQGRPSTAYSPREWKVVSVKRTGRSEPVFCAVVPETHSFVLDGYILSGNSWWRDDSPLQIDRSGRSIGKSRSIVARCLSFSLIHTGQEMVITAPELNHLTAITQLIETQFKNGPRLLQEMLPKGKNQGITHRPFMVELNTNSRILGRIPQRSGVGVKGCMVAGSVVLTKRGLLPIEDVIEGDFVWSHLNRWSEVRVVQDLEDDCYEVDCQGIRPLVVSSGHRLWVRTMSFDGTFGPLHWAWVDRLSAENPAYWTGSTRLPDEAMDFRMPRGHVVDGYVSYKIHNINSVGSRHVYNVVSDDHSYWAEGVFHHNTHPLWLEMDESQNFSHEAWQEIIETLKRGVPGACWRSHGVSRGVRDDFYAMTQPGSGWKVHTYTAMSRPTWTQEEREEKVKMYGSRNAPDYKRNILGIHGDAQNALFVLSRLMATVDSDELSTYNQEEYKSIRITSEALEDYGAVDFFLDFPGSHKEYKRTWAGCDVGWTASPTEILVFGETATKGQTLSVLKLLTRIHLERLSAPAQADVVLRVLDFYNCKVFAMDATGAGLPLFQVIQDKAPRFLNRIKGYGFAEKRVVEIDQSIEIDEFRGDPVKDAGIERNLLDYASDSLREFVDQKRIQLPWDTDLIGEWQGQTWTAAKGVTTDASGRPSRAWSKGKVHTLDAGKVMILGYKLTPLEELFEAMKKRDSVPDLFLGESGASAEVQRAVIW